MCFHIAHVVFGRPKCWNMLDVVRSPKCCFNMWNICGGPYLGPHPPTPPHPVYTCRTLRHACIPGSCVRAPECSLAGGHRALTDASPPAQSWRRKLRCRRDTLVPFPTDRPAKSSHEHRRAHAPDDAPASQSAAAASGTGWPTTCTAEGARPRRRRGPLAREATRR